MNSNLVRRPREGARCVAACGRAAAARNNPQNTEKVLTSTHDLTGVPEAHVAILAVLDMWQQSYVEEQG